MKSLFLLFFFSTCFVAQEDQDDLLEQANFALEDGELGEARPLFERYLKLHPEDGAAHFKLGRIQKHLGDLPMAEKSFARALELKLSPKLAAYNIACCQALRGAKQPALKNLRRAASLGADLRQAWADPDLVSLQGELGFVLLLDELAPGSTRQKPQARQFDFWVGDWVVQSASGGALGSNKISLLEGGGGILEQWTSAGGGTGTSLSYFDPHDREWVQVWVTRSDGASVARGGLQDGAMVLKGYHAANRKLLTSRTTWTPLEDGGVHQHWQSTRDGGLTWKTEFDGYYSRR